jgi:hypothetical protein
LDGQSAKRNQIDPIGKFFHTHHPDTMTLTIISALRSLIDAMIGQIVTGRSGIAANIAKLPALLKKA